MSSLAEVLGERGESLADRVETDSCRLFGGWVG